jgi:hypothetical protein
MVSRRKLITGLVSLVAAPAIVPYSSLMPVKALAPDFVESNVTHVFSAWVRGPGDKPWREITMPCRVTTGQELRWCYDKLNGPDFVDEVELELRPLRDYAEQMVRGTL